MATDHVPGSLVPYDRFDVAEGFYAAAQLLILRIARLQIDAWVIGCCVDLIDWYGLDVHNYLQFFL
ncbi:hypothetical protein D3C78_1880350 [compost metagenome]